jgi:hypothetical protein
MYYVKLKNNKIVVVYVGFGDDYDLSVRYLSFLTSSTLSDLNEIRTYKKMVLDKLLKLTPVCLCIPFREASKDLGLHIEVSLIKRDFS